MSFDEYGEPIKKKQPKEGFKEGIPVVQKPDPLPDPIPESVAKADVSPRTTREAKDYATIYEEEDYGKKEPERETVVFTDPDTEYTTPKDEIETETVTFSAPDDYTETYTTVKPPSKKELREKFGMNVDTSSRGVTTSPPLLQPKPISLDKMLRAKGVEGDISDIERLAKRGGFGETRTGKLLLEAERIEDKKYGFKGKLGGQSARFTAGFVASGEAIVRPETPDLWSFGGGMTRRGILGGSARLDRAVEQATGQKIKLGGGLEGLSKKKLGTFGAEAAVQTRSADAFGASFIVGASAGEVVASILAGKAIVKGAATGKKLIKAKKMDKVKSGFGKIKLPSILGKKKKTKGLTKTKALLMSDIKPKPKKTIDQIIGWGKRPETTVKESKQFRKILGKTLKTTKTTTTRTRKTIRKTKPKDDTFKEIRSSTGQVQLIKMKPPKQITKAKTKQKARQLGMYGKAPQIKAKPPKVKQIQKTKTKAKTKQKARQLGMYGKTPIIKIKPRTIAIQKPRPIATAKPKTKAVPKPKLITMTKPKTITIAKRKTKAVPKPKLITMTKPKTSILTKPRTIAVPKPKTITTPKPKTITVPKPKTITTPKPKTITVPKPRTTTIPKPRTPTIPITRTTTIPKPPTTTTPTFPPIIPPFRLPKGASGASKKKKKKKKGKKFTRINPLAKGLKI